MPQMAPTNWILLYFMFNMIFILFNFMNYYCFMLQSKKTIKKNNKNNFINLKW